MQFLRKYQARSLLAVEGSSTLLLLMGSEQSAPSKKMRENSRYYSISQSRAAPTTTHQN
jgi:hypothetical protein